MYDDDKRRLARRRHSRHDTHLLNVGTRRSSLATSAHSHSTTDENLNINSLSIANNVLPPQTQSNLYENLSTFSFGAPSAGTSGTSRVDIANIAPFASDYGDDDEEEDFRSERAKMRAIDDGTRRPSLPQNIPDEQRRPSQPINIPHPRAEQQPDTKISMSASPLMSWPAGADSPPQLGDVEPEDDQDSDQPPQQESALAGFDMAFIMAAPEAPSSSPSNGSNNKRSQRHRDGALSNHQSHSNISSSFLFPFGSLSAAAAARRPSTASALSDGQNDTFFRHINKNDTEYTSRRKQWSFRRREIVRPANGQPKPNAQLWECYVVGRFHVGRCKNSSDAPDKPPPTRLLIRPYSSYNPQSPTSPMTPGSTNSSARPLHPTALIHKHSRAWAYSIFRASQLKNTHMSASQCVLLAPLKVQTHYTETKSTRALKTYDFLEDGRSAASSNRSASSTSSMSYAGSSAGDSRGDRHGNGTRSQTSSGGSTTTVREGSSSPTRPTINLATGSSSNGNWNGYSNAHSYSNASLQHNSRMHSASLSPPPARSPIEEEDDELEEDYEGRDQHRRGPGSTGSSRSASARKSHRDAFGALDERQLDLFRSNGGSAHEREPVPVPVEVSRVKQSRFGTALKKAFNVNHESSDSVGHTPTVDLLAGHSHSHSSSNGHSHRDRDKDSLPDTTNGRVYQPPWLTLPPRAQQEKNERTLHQLNKSFEDVGLLPHRKKSSHHSSSSGASTGSNSLLRRVIKGSASGSSSGSAPSLEDVPPGSPLMLLPMWAAESPNTNGLPDHLRPNSIPLHERRYLLIYYVEFDSNKEGEGGKGDRKRTRGSSSTRGSQDGYATDRDRGEKDPYAHVLTAFRVVAKVLSYDDVRTSGLRLPNEGIEVSPSVSPHSPGYTQFSHPPLPLSNFGETMVIAICPSAEAGIEFVPEGLDKLGLCYRSENVPISSIAEPTERERLSPVGRAIVEMAWCGCLSVMGLATTL